MKETNKEEKKKAGAFSFFSGLILIIIAVGLVLMKNGVNLFGNSDNPDKIFIKAHMGVFDKINEEVLEYLNYCGSNARENDGHLNSETFISTEKELSIDNSSIIGSLIGMIGLGQVSVKEGYSAKNEDGVFTILRDSDKKVVYSKETILAGMDFSALGKSSALKEKTVKKLLSRYEEMFIKELQKDGYEYNRDAIVNLDKVIQLESSYSFDYSNDDICKALNAVLDDIATDKKWKKAYSAMQNGDFSDYIESVKGQIMGADSLLNAIKNISGTIYVGSDKKLNYAELTFEVDDKALEEKLTKDASWLIKSVIDIDPEFTVSVGHTVQGDVQGFKLGIVNSEGQTRFDFTGHGEQKKTGIFNGRAVGITGVASLTYKGKTGDITFSDLQFIDMKKGVYFNGTFSLALDQLGIVMNAEATNNEQECSYEVSLSGKRYLSGKITIKDK